MHAEHPFEKRPHECLPPLHACGVTDSEKGARKPAAQPQRLEPFRSRLFRAKPLELVVDDTPRQATTYLRECPQDERISCETPDFFFNFMNYTDDACMAMFTVGQKMRMLAALEGPRSGLLTGNTLCEPLSTSTQVPADQWFHIWSDGGGSHIWIEPRSDITTKLDLRLFNLLGQQCWQGQKQIYARERLELPALSPGVYLLHLQWNGKSYSHKIIIH